jgi:hypothetical protein
VSTPERKIDHSPGWDQGELENLSKDAAVEYLLMPERVKKLEGEIQAIHVDLEELTGALKRIFNARARLDTKLLQKTSIFGLLKILDLLSR